MKILITGATGFIGRRLAKELAESFGSDQVTALVKADAGNELERTGRAVLAELGIKMIEIDLLTRYGLENVPKSPDTVFHLASCTDMGEPDHSINDVGTRNLLESIAPIKPGMHFVFASTIAIHDNRDDFDLPITESTPYPKYICNEYGRSKHRTLENLKRESAAKQFYLTTVRVSGVYGENTRPSGLYDMVGRLCDKRSFITRINWPGRVSMIYVSDIAKLFVQVSRRSDKEKYFEVIPSVEALNLQDMSALTYAAKNIPAPSPISLPRFFWKTMTFISRYKAAFEAVLPHKLYNRVWQLFVLSNNEFWNESLVLHEAMPNFKFVRFADFVERRYAPSAVSDVNRNVARG